MTDRIKAILSAGDSAGFPELARILALDTDVSEEAATTVFAAAAKDLAAATGGDDEPPARHSGGQQASNLGFNVLGASEVIGGTSREMAKNAWGKAVTAVNSGKADTRI